MMRQAFLGTSEELREAAKIDGASEFRIFYQIMVPIIIPTIAAVCTTQFVSSWNSYLDPLIFINKSALYTLPLVLDNFVSMEATQYGLMMAACCLATVPVIWQRAIPESGHRIRQTTGSGLCRKNIPIF